MRVAGICPAHFCTTVLARLWCRVLCSKSTRALGAPAPVRHAAPRPGLGARCALSPKLHFSRLFLLPRTLAQTSTEPTFPSARYPSSVLSRLPHHDLCPSALPQKQAARLSILIASRAHRQRRLRLCHLYGRTVRTGPQECSVSAYLTKRCEEMSWHCTPGPEKPLLEISSFI